MPIDVDVVGRDRGPTAISRRSRYHDIQEVNCNLPSKKSQVLLQWPFSLQIHFSLRCSKPQYDRCVALVTEAALREMQYPGLVCVCTPIIVGLVFRFVGEASNRVLLGAEVLASYLMFGTVTGILMALFLDTAGGAWDNAKKYIELGNYGGKNSDAHKAAVTGDTVGDPFVSKT